ARGDFIRQTMATIPGRIYVHDQLLRSHVFSTSFDRDPVMMAFKEGERNNGLQLLTDVMANCPDQFVTMMREANERSSARDHANPDARYATGSQYPGSADGNGGTEISNEYDPFDGNDSGDEN